jgi:hypothetical protein
MLGLDFFRKIVALQRKHKPPNRRIAKGIQTNDTLLNELASFCCRTKLRWPPRKCKTNTESPRIRNQHTSW